MRFRTNPYVALALVTALNFFDFIDRSILFQVQPLIQREFHASKMQIGLLTTAFTICLIAGLLVLGRMADRYPRRPIMVTGAITFSIATLLTALTWDFRTLLIRHAIVAIGDASMIAAPAYVADLFPQEKRGRMLAFLYMAGPSGGALGYVIGGLLGNLYGWRAPFYVVCGPGVLIALLLLTTREPERGAQDQVSNNAERDSLPALLRDRAYVMATLGLAMINFASAGAQVWLPDFLTRERGLTLVAAGTFIGAVILANGVGATLAGGWLADNLRRRRQDAHYIVGAAGAALAVPAFAAAIYFPVPALFPAIFLASGFLVATSPPMGAAVIQVAGARIRSTAFAIHFVTIRLLGDALAPPLIGRIADRTGSLQTGFLPAVAAVGLAAVILVYGRRYAASPQIAEAGAAASGGLGV